jgi:hypothetical protein
VFRRYGEAYRREHRPSGEQRQAMSAVQSCRTAALGGFAQRCSRCQAVVVRYAPCGNRHCPKCQTLAKERWLSARRAELLAVEYFHVVFTLPHELNALVAGNPRLIYGLLLRCAAETLQTFGRDSKWLGGELGVTLVLHTWSQTLAQHLHVHCVVTGGALAPGGNCWVPAKRGFLFPVRALARVFRGKYLDALQQAHRAGQVRAPRACAHLREETAFTAWLKPLHSRDWVVYSKRPFAGPEQVLAYLGRYTHRVALTNERIVSAENGEIRFRYRDRARANRSKVLSLPAEEFIRRFLTHVLPRGFMRIRHYGLLANRGRSEKLRRCRRLLEQIEPKKSEPESAEALMLRTRGIDIGRCPYCRVGRLGPNTRVDPVMTLLLRPPATGPPESR